MILILILTTIQLIINQNMIDTFFKLIFTLSTSLLEIPNDSSPPVETVYVEVPIEPVYIDVPAEIEPVEEGERLDLEDGDEVMEIPDDSSEEVEDGDVE